jgi:release factor glutamine methyltransferase
MIRVIDKLREISKTLNVSGIEAASKEAEILIKHATAIDTVEMYRDNPELSEEQVIALEKMVMRRSRREPLQYILGYEEFLDLKLLLSEGVLIPRPETEFMAEQAMKIMARYKGRGTKDKGGRILDLCTGSGCLALAIAKEFPDMQIYGSDISKVAIDCARRNARINNIKNVIFLKGDLFGPFKQAPLFDLIISNPPYVRTGEIETLQPEIKHWEPINAINGGPDGLDFYRRIIPQASRFLKDNGILMLEIGDGYIEDVSTMIKNSGYAGLEIIKDYAQIERIVLARWKRH